MWDKTFLGVLVSVIMMPSWCKTSFAKQLDGQQLLKEFSSGQPSLVEQANGFRVGRFDRQERTATIEDATVVVALLTPLNSTIHKEGDIVQAEVISSKLANGTTEVPWIPKGTVLQGTIERSRAATYGQTDGSFCISFYSGVAGGRAFDINAIPAGQQKEIKPLDLPPSKKERVRDILMAASFIAIPMAMGTGGTSLAITAGAGAIIGGALAPDGKHIKGAINGAWQGSGLSVLDPIVKKGRPVVLPAGTQLSMQLREPATIPVSILKLAKETTDDAPAAQLETQAKIVKAPNTAEITSRCNQLLEQKNLAMALALLDQSLNSAPSNDELLRLRASIIEKYQILPPSTSDIKEN